MNKNFFALLCLLLLACCNYHTDYNYSAFIQDIDGKNRLKIDFIHTDIPSSGTHIPFVFWKTVANKELAFRVHIGHPPSADNSKYKNPSHYIESLKIHSFSYKLDDQPEEQLIADFEGSLWTQGWQKAKIPHKPYISYEPDTNIFVKISFNLNGEEYSFEGKMEAVESTEFNSIIAVYSGI